MTTRNTHDDPKQTRAMSEDERPLVRHAERFRLTGAGQNDRGRGHHPARRQQGRQLAAPAERDRVALPLRDRADAARLPLARPGLHQRHLRRRLSRARALPAANARTHQGRRGHAALRGARRGGADRAVARRSLRRRARPLAGDARAVSTCSSASRKRISPILLEGESGTGKERLAEAIHLTLAARAQALRRLRLRRRCPRR